MTEAKSYDSITNRDDLSAFLGADLAAYGVKSWRFYGALSHPCLYYQRIMRRVEFHEAAGFRFVSVLRRIQLKIIGILLGVSVPPGTFGRGLTIPHYGSVVVNDAVRGGMFCRLHSATNIGVANGLAPTLGDGVYVGPGSVIFGGIKLGSFVTVGANSVVSIDVPDHTLVAGVPAVLKSGRRVPPMPGRIIVELERIREAT